MVKRVAGLELNALTYSRGLPVEVFQNARIRSSGTPVYDVNGEVLFHRVPVVRGTTPIGYADIAAHSAFMSPLLGVTYGQDWNERAILNKAALAAQKQQRGLKFSRTRFVAYSYPKIGVQFLMRNAEVLMLELGTWKPIPPMRRRTVEEPPSNFERWSLIDETPEARKRKNLEQFKERLAKWDDICPPERPPKDFRPEYIRPMEFEIVIEPPRAKIDKRELHFSLDDSDHHPCYEIRGQLTNVWCVAASVQMVLDFYRYDYDQTRIAQELRLGTLNNPNGLPYSRDNDVVTVLEDLTSNALSANMNTTPSWSEFKKEIRANRPLISFVPGHSRTVAGYIHSKLFNWYEFRGLLVYNPWPPTSGVITRWENFDNTTYRLTFTAELTLV